MKNKINILYLLPLLAMVACGRFLEKAPDSRLRLDSFDKIAELLVTAYSSGSIVFLETMSDNVGPDNKNIQLLTPTQAYRWENITEESQDTPSYFWSTSYTAIAHANQALVALDEVDDLDVKRRDAIRGEALACRAYAHFMLVNIFAKHYDPISSKTDLGVVCMDAPETTLLTSYERSSVEETYQFIERDLLEALSLVTNIYYKNSGKYHFTREALYAFASRFYLFKGDYENCIKYSKELVGNYYTDKFVRNYRAIFSGSTAEVLARKFTAPTVDANLMLRKIEYGSGYTPFFGYRLTADIHNSISLRGISESDNRFLTFYTYTNTSYFIPKFERELVRRPSLTSAGGYPYTIEIAFRSEEVILNLIEAWILSDKITEAEDYFNGYITKIYDDKVDLSKLKNTYKGLYPSVDSKVLLLQMVLDERRREFIEEGLRWFDLKRYNMEVVHIDVDGSVHRLSADDSRKALQIPSSAIEYGGLVPNEIHSDKIPQLVKPNNN